LRILLSFIPGAMLFSIKPELFMIFPLLAWGYLIVSQIPKEREIDPYTYRRAFLCMLFLSGLVFLFNTANTLREGESLSYTSLIYQMLFLLFDIIALKLMQMSSEPDVFWHFASAASVVVSFVVSAVAALLLLGILVGGGHLIGLLVNGVLHFVMWLAILFAKGPEAVPERKVSELYRKTVETIEAELPVNEGEMVIGDGILVKPYTVLDDRQIFRTVFLIGVAILSLIALFVIIRLALGSRIDRGKPGKTDGTGIFSPGKQGRRGKGKASYESANGVRSVYNEYLLFLKSSGVFPESSDTSEEVLKRSEEKMGEIGPEEERLRKIYLKARYSEETVTAEDAEEARNCLDAIIAARKESKSHS
ncbi:MAG: DUF4129 domain-containing protein, partial [Lachnospiraceae bacterium]|nr:DUF4129 domain-containing protein [Lachnospiraceae bacterium]